LHYLRRQKSGYKCIEGFFEKKEQKYLLESPDETTFCWRIKATYRMYQREGILFKLKASKKVSVVLCFDIHAKAKTVRRHWFARISIEEFFDS